MLYLHVSNRTENLLLHLVEVLRYSGRRTPFAREYFLIQSQGMERVISQTMANHFTSWCHFQFLLPMQFLEECAQRLGIDDNGQSYRRELLLWRLEDLLRDIGAPVYSQLHGYLAGEDAPLKRFQLATQLASLFDQYQMMRPEMIAGWPQGTWTSDPSEVWQRQLWLRLRDQLPKARHRGEVIGQLIDRLAREDGWGGRLPERLNVFGLSTMVPLFLKFLQALARHIDVHLYVLSPCRHYWGDMARRKNAVEADTSHPLLVSLGGQGRDFQRLLFDDVVYQQDFSSYEDPLDGRPETLLLRLQSDLLSGEVVAGSAWSEADESFRIVSCHSRIRELEVLKEHVLQWLYQDPELELRDIVVMAPDIQEYNTLIPAVFSDIQHSIADRSLRLRNPMIAAFVAFLDLFGGRFCWDEMIDLLGEPAVARKLGLSAGDLDSIRSWVLSSGIRWGLSAAGKREAGLADFPESTWACGLERMLMGYAIDSDDLIDGVLPFTGIEGGGGVLLGSLCQFVALIEEAMTEFMQERSLAAWSRLLLGYSAQLLCGDGENAVEYRQLQEILSGLGEEAGEIHRGVVGFPVIRSWLASVTSEARSSSGFLRGQLTFCSMLPMRSIPFRHVCLLGLNEGEFPRSDVSLTFDLLSATSRPGDRSRRLDDRYQFLEALLAARDHLYLSFIGQSVKSNESLPPSVVVAELLDVLSGSYGAGDLVVCHPLQPYSRKYFTGQDARLFSFQESLCRVAENFTHPPEPPGPWWQGGRDVGIDSVAWLDFLTFFQHPQRWFMRACLGVRVRDEIQVVAESEPFANAGLDKYQTDGYLLKRMLERDGSTQLLKRLQVEGRWPLGTSGRLLFEERIAQLEAFMATITALRPGPPTAPVAFDLELDSVRLHGVLANVHEEGIFLFRHAHLKAKDCLVGWLHHLVHHRLTGQLLPTLVLGDDTHLVIEGEPPFTPDLEQLMTIFQDGCRTPSRLFLDAGFAGLRGEEKGKDLRAAAWQDLKRSWDEGYDPETVFLFGGCDPGGIFDEEFMKLCRTVLAPLRRYLA